MVFRKNYYQIVHLILYYLIYKKVNRKSFLPELPIIEINMDTIRIN